MNDITKKRAPRKRTKRRDFFGFVAIEEDKDIGAASFSIGRSLETVSESMKGARDIDEKEDIEDKAEPEKLGFAETMNKIMNLNFAQFELLTLLSFMGPALMLTSFEREIFAPTRDAGTLVEQTSRRKVYGVTEPIYLSLMKKRDRIQRTSRGLEALAKALLMSVVASFDSGISDVVRDTLLLRGESHKTGNKTVLLSDVFSASSIDEIKDRFINNEVYEFSRGSHDDQVTFIETNFHVKIKDFWKRWPDFIEIFERRNLVAHGEKTFTKRYVELCLKAGHKGSDKTLGTPLELSDNYLKQAAGILFEFSVLLVFMLWRKQFPLEEAAAFRSLNNATYKLVEGRRYQIASLLLEFALKLEKTKADNETWNMMKINLASAYKHMKEDGRCDEVLSSVDWSGSEDRFKICVAALRGEINDVIDLMDYVTAARNPITKQGFRDWPVFRFMRNEERFQQKFEAIFGEKLQLVEPEKTQVSSTDKPTSDHVPDLATVH